MHRPAEANVSMQPPFCPIIRWNCPGSLATRFHTFASCRVFRPIGSKYDPLVVSGSTLSTPRETSLGVVHSSMNSVGVRRPIHSSTPKPCDGLAGFLDALRFLTSTSYTTMAWPGMLRDGHCKTNVTCHKLDDEDGIFVCPRNRFHFSP